MGIASLILFIGITFYPEPGVAPDYTAAPAKTMEECHMMKATFELSTLMSNAGSPETTWVYPEGFCITFVSDQSKQDL